MRAAYPGLRELGLIVVVKVAGVFEDPAGEVAGFRQAWDGGRGGAGLAERENVVAGGAVSARLAALFELGVQLADVGAAFVPPLVQVGFAVVQGRRASVPDRGEQLVDGGGAVEAAHGLLGQAGLAHDGLDAVAPRRNLPRPRPRLGRNGTFTEHAGALQKDLQRSMA